MSSSQGEIASTRTFLWCVPRSVSTAFAKCLSFINDTEVWFEPYAYSYVARVEYKLHTKLDIPIDYEGNEDAFQKAKELTDFVTKCNNVADRLA